MTETLLIAIPTVGERALRDHISEIFAKTPTFTFVKVVDGEISEVTVEENAAADFPQGAGPIVIKNLKDKGVDVVVSSELGPGAKTLLEVGGIRMVKVEQGAKVRDAVDEALRQVLQPSIQS
jgi:predicted Fe-Mo cluster-binding NifX family protein